MKIGYFDCFSGASGDMILGALIDAGLSPRFVNEVLKKLRLPSVRLRVKKVLKGGLSGTHVILEGKKEKKPHRTLREMLSLIDRSRLDPDLKKKSREIFRRLASTEGEIHRVPMETIHFHELGGLDSIVDIVGAVSGIRQLGIERLYVSRVNVGAGFVRCEHGILPVPSPAALSLMVGKPIYSTGVEKELLTPTGAVLLSTLGSEFGKMPPMRVERIGYGAGRDDLPHPNLLRLMIGTLDGTAAMERVMVVETNIDDMNPQFYDYVMERLMKMGVMDVFFTPILMKKNRPATLLTVICPVEQLPSVTQFLLKETTTLGLRWREEGRVRADREMVTLRTKHGIVHFKLAWWEGRLINLSPEYEDCKKLALKKGVPLKDVFEEAKKAAMTLWGKEKKSLHLNGP